MVSNNDKNKTALNRTWDRFRQWFANFALGCTSQALTGPNKKRALAWRRTGTGILWTEERPGLALAQKHKENSFAIVNTPDTHE